MKIKTHSRPLTVLSDLMNTDRDDCAGVIEDMIQEMREIDKPEHHQIGEELTQEELTELTTEVMGHYDRESEILYPGTKELISQLQIF